MRIELLTAGLLFLLISPVAAQEEQGRPENFYDFMKGVVAQDQKYTESIEKMNEKIEKLKRRKEELKLYKEIEELKRIGRGAPVTNEDKKEISFQATAGDDPARLIYLVYSKTYKEAMIQTENGLRRLMEGESIDGHRRVKKILKDRVILGYGNGAERQLSVIFSRR